MDWNVSYQTALRTVGAHLDERRVNFVSLVELPHGMAVRYQIASDGEVVATVFDDDELMGRRRVKRHRFQLRIGRETVDPRHCDYQDFFRAIGYQLDRAEAKSIIIDEAEDGLMLTYQHLDPHSGYVWRKRLLMIGSEEKRDIVQAAHARRNQGRSVLGLVSVNAHR